MHESLNLVVLRGVLSSEPVVRHLASGSVLVSLEVTTTTDEGNWSVPVAWFDPRSVPEWPAGREVVVTGVVRRRFFRSGGLTQSRTEVVASEVSLASSARRVERLISTALLRMGGDR